MCYSGFVKMAVLLTSKFELAERLFLLIVALKR